MGSQLSAAEVAFADGLRHKWAPGLNAIESFRFNNVESWLTTGTYSWVSASPGSFTLDLRGGSADLTDSLASEISRFSCAAYESLLDSSPPEDAVRSLGWSLVRHYYASFYCAHALMRIAGSSLNHLSGETTSLLNRIGSQYLGASPQIFSGLYQIERTSQNNDIITFRKVSSGNGGSHEDMWSLFLSLLLEVETLVIRSQGQTPGALEAVRISSELRKVLCTNGRANGGWASSVRNAINYRHDYGIWYPYQKRQNTCTELSTRMNRWRPDDPRGLEIGSSTDDLEKFSDICNVISRLLTASLKDIAHRSPKAGKNFVDRYPFKLLRIRSCEV